MKDFNIHHTKNFTVMSNYHFQERKMSLKAKGLLSLMLSLPEDWDYSIKGLTALSKDGRDAVMVALQELEKFGYLTRTMIKGNDGKFKGYQYDIYEMPQTDKNNPCTENPDTEKPNTENPTQYNTKEIKNEINKNNDILIYCNKQKSSSNIEYEINDEDENEEIKTNYIKTYPPKGTSYNEKHQRTQMILNQGLDPKLYDQLHNLVQRLYYDKIFTPEECIILSEKLTKLDEEFDYIYVAKALSYTLSHSKSKRIKNRCGYILASLRDSIENIIISEKERAKSPEQRMRELEESIRECYYKYHGNEPDSKYL